MKVDKIKNMSAESFKYLALGGKCKKGFELKPSLIFATLNQLTFIFIMTASLYSICIQP